ncbi:unnamed protein product [Orchesella dallaii]|uniref:Uncharacterized protein n=1 Tax=Orchesella dallaii TaxID=48710 RepID=A0ABP1RBJ7_9HEXA
METFMPTFDVNRCMKFFIADLFLMGFISVSFIFCFIYLAYGINHPAAPLVIWNWEFLRERFYNWWSNLAFLCVFWYGANHICFVVEFHFIMGFLYLNIFYRILKTELKVSGDGRQLRNQHTDDSLRIWETYVVENRSFEIAHINVMDFYSPMIVIMNWCVAQVAIVCNVMLLSRWEKLPTISVWILIFWSVASEIMWIFFLGVGGGLLRQGEKTIASWKRRNWGSKFNNCLMKRFTKSCKPIRLSYGKMFTIQRKSVLTFMQAILRGTFRFYLAIKK